MQKNTKVKIKNPQSFFYGFIGNIVDLSGACYAMVLLDGTYAGQPTEVPRNMKPLRLHLTDLESVDEVSLIQLNPAGDSR